MNAHRADRPSGLSNPADGALRTLTAAIVSGVAGCAAWISYTHIKDLALTYGQHGADAVITPLVVDGLVLAAGLFMLHEARANRSFGWLAWLALGLGVTATLAANVAYGAAYGIIGALVSAWPAVAFVVSAELLMIMVRRSRRSGPVPHDTVPAAQEQAANAGMPQPAVAMNGHTSRALEVFGDPAVTGTVPGTREIKRTLRIGTDNAMGVRNDFEAMAAAGNGSAPIR